MTRESGSAGRRPPRRPPLLRVVAAMVRVAVQAGPWAYAAFLATSLAFTALLIADLHLIRVLLGDLPLFVEGRLSLRAVLVTILLLGGVNVIDTLMNAAMNLLYEYLSKRAGARMTEQMSRKAARLDLIRFESAELHDRIEKANAGRDRGFDAMEAVIFSAIFHGGYFLFLGLYLVRLEPWLVVGVFGAFLPVALSRLIRASAFYRTEGAVAPLRREFAHYEACLTDRAFFKETRTSGAVPFFRRLYDRTLAAYNREMWRTELRTGAIDLGLRVLTLGGYIGLLVLLIRFVIGGRVSPGLFGAVYFAMDSIFKWFEELFGRLGSAFEDAAFGGNYLEFMDTPERRTVGACPGPSPGGTPGARGIVLDRVSFRYPGAGQDAVCDVSMAIRPGESVAIVGENGAGKSTLVRLITGLYEPDSGSVRTVGVDLRDAAGHERFHGVSAVFQHAQRYRMTLRDNVRIAEPEAAGSAGAYLSAAGAHLSGADGVALDRRVGESLSRAGFAAVASAAGDVGLDTTLAPEFGGVDLSGGEWQRVAIARGLYRAHDTIVLDESTAAIDPLEEDRIYRTFLESARGRTAIVVTHRLGLARIADRIVVMDRGRIVEEGTHSDLMASDGRYARMFRAQAAWYVRE